MNYTAQILQLLLHDALIHKIVLDNLRVVNGIPG